MTQKEETNMLHELGVFATDILALLYSVLLYKFIWEWFLAEKLFMLTYWELFLSIIIIRFIFSGGGSMLALRRLDRHIGKQSVQERIGFTVGRRIGETCLFGILFIVHVLIAHYS